MHNRIWKQLESNLVPVVTFNQLDEVQPIVEILQEVGFKSIEITLRTDSGIPAIEYVKKNYPKLLVGAGTVITASQANKSLDSGAEFLVSPGWSDEVFKVLAKDKNPPPDIWLPGVVTSSEVMKAMAAGFSYLKFFPAQAIGGVKLLSNYASVFPDLYFCPTGGVAADNIGKYMDLPNVFAVGGSWASDKVAIHNKDWPLLKRKILEQNLFEKAF